MTQNYVCLFQGLGLLPDERVHICMYVILRILKHMALVDFVTLPTYRVEQCALLGSGSERPGATSDNGFIIKKINEN